LLGLTGLLLLLAFPAPGWWPLALLALAPAGLVAARASRLRRLAWTSWLAFLTWWLIAAHWLVPVTGPGWAFMAAALAVYWTGALLVAAWLHRRHNLAMTLALPCAWTSLELIRAHFPMGGFNWFELGHALASYHPGQAPGRLAQVADLLGAHGITFLTAMTAGLLVDLLTRPLLRPPQHHRSRVRGTIAGPALLWGLLFAGALLYGQYRITQHQTATREGPRIALIQSNVPQSNKNQPTRETDRATWNQLLELSEQALTAEPPPELLLWPETMVPAAINAEAVADFQQRARTWAAMTDAQARQLQDLARQQGVSSEELPAYMSQWFRERAGYRDKLLALAEEWSLPLLVGAAAEQIEPGDRRHNAVYLLEPGADAPTARYDKLHLVPFGEYVPWLGVVPGLKDWFFQYLTPYGFDYTLDPGGETTVFQPANQDLRLVTPICFEDTDAGLVRRMIQAPTGKRAEVIANVTNDGWFNGYRWLGSAQRWQHLQMATLRSIENRVPTARAVNTGVSGFVDSLGRVRRVVRDNARAGHVSGTATARLHLDERRPPYATLGRWPAAGLAALTGLLVLGGFARADTIGG
jgi:apolipoprotein N-acyltransferase